MLFIGDNMDLIYSIIKAKYSNKVAKATKTLKQVMRFINENKQLSENEKKKLKETFNRIYNIVYSNTKSKTIANRIITELAFKHGILINNNYRNTIISEFHKYTKPF